MNKKIEELYNKIDGLNMIIDEQALEISQLKEQKKQAIEYTKTTLKFARLEKDFEKETILLNFLKILGDKEND